MATQKHAAEKKPQLTVEEQEMQLRLERAEKGSFSIQVLDKSNAPFATYKIVGEKEVSYSVEIRALDEKINSCSCPDYYVNTLGSCKHIEAVL